MDEISTIYQQMLEERVTPFDFIDYMGDDFPDVDDKNVDQKYNHISPNIPERISLRDYNRIQLDALKKYFRSKMNFYDEISDDEMSKFVMKLIQDRPEVVKKARLHIASKNPDLFDYVD